MKSALHPSYTFDTKCCFHCRHIVSIHDYDDAPEYYCGRNAPKRPPSGSVVMREMFPTDKRYSAFGRAWDKWSRPREVKAFGTYEKFEAVT